MQLLRTVIIINKRRFLLTPMQIYSLNCPLKMFVFFFFGGGVVLRREDLTSEAKWPKRNTLTTKTHCGCIERKSMLLRVSCSAVEEPKKAREGTTSPVC